MPKTARHPVVIATDLTPNAEPALIRGRAHAEAIGAPWLVLHVIPDVLRHHPLLPTRNENDAALSLDVEKKAAELVVEQVRSVLSVSPDDYRVVVEVGDAEDEIVRIAEEERAPLVVVGARPRQGAERVLGHVAERVVRYAHGSVLVARAGTPTHKVIVATDFTEGSMPAVRFAGTLVEKAGVEVTLLHVTQPPQASAITSAFSALGSPWLPPPPQAIEELQKLGLEMLKGLAKQYGFAHHEQLEGDPDEVIAARADDLGAEMIVMGSHGRTGLRRLVLGSNAEKVVRTTRCSVLVARDAPSVTT